MTADQNEQRRDEDPRRAQAERSWSTAETDAGAVADDVDEESQDDRRVHIDDPNDKSRLTSDNN